MISQFTSFTITTLINNIRSALRSAHTKLHENRLRTDKVWYARRDQTTKLDGDEHDEHSARCTVRCGTNIVMFTPHVVSRNQQQSADLDFLWENRRFSYFYFSLIARPYASRSSHTHAATSNFPTKKHKRQRWLGVCASDLFKNKFDLQFDFLSFANTHSSGSQRERRDRKCWARTQLASNTFRWIPYCLSAQTKRKWERTVSVLDSKCTFSKAATEWTYELRMFVYAPFGQTLSFALSLSRRDKNSTET